MPDENVAVGAPERVSYYLTHREVQVLALLVEGFSSKKIADRLGLRFYTVTTYLKRIYKKLGAHNRAQVVGKVLTERILNRAASNEPALVPSSIGERVFAGMPASQPLVPILCAKSKTEEFENTSQLYAPE